MAYQGYSAMDAHKYYGGSGTFADRRRTWEELGLGTAAEYQGTAVQNAQLIAGMNQYGGLTRPTVQQTASTQSSGAAAVSAPSSSSGQSSVAALRSKSNELQQQLAALAPYDTSAMDKIYQSYLAQKEAIGPFSYDAQSDPTYQQYAAQYQREGRRAMENTLAQVAARTGGLASSYATSAAQQQYDNYMAQLQDVIPQLEQIAYQRYRNELSDLDSKFETEYALEKQKYDLYTDKYNRLGKEISAAQSLEEAEYKNLEDLITTSGYNPSDAELYAAGMTRERANALKGVYDLAVQTAAAKGSSSSSSDTPKKAGDVTKDKWTILDEVAKMKGNDDAKKAKLAEYNNNGVITDEELVELGKYLGLITEETAKVALSETEQFYKKNPAKFLEMFGAKRFREVYGARAEEYLKKLNT